MTAHSSPITSEEEVNILYKEKTIPNMCMKMPESVHYVLDTALRLQDDDSEYAETIASDSLRDFSQMNQGRPPSSGILAEARNERRYRLLLEHQFHPSRKSSVSLPLVQ